MPLFSTEIAVASTLLTRCRFRAIRLEIGLVSAISSRNIHEKTPVHVNGVFHLPGPIQMRNSGSNYCAQTAQSIPRAKSAETCSSLLPLSACNPWHAPALRRREPTWTDCRIHTRCVGARSPLMDFISSTAPSRGGSTSHLSKCPSPPSAASFISNRFIARYSALRRQTVVCRHFVWRV